MGLLPLDSLSPKAISATHNDHRDKIASNYWLACIDWTLTVNMRVSAITFALA